MAGIPPDPRDPSRAHHPPQPSSSSPSAPGGHHPSDPHRPGPYPPYPWPSTRPGEAGQQQQQQQQHPPPYPPVSQYPYPPGAYAPASYPPPGSYPPPPSAEQEHAGHQQPHQYPPSLPPLAYPPPPHMAAMHAPVPGHQDPYRLPPPPGAYGYPPQVVYQAAAPRQRTAIACRYCRRRKIRCSGFDSSSDGRCSNCIRFNQECLFTPVSSQAQAFVPAHAAYPHLRNLTAGRPPQGVAFYGAHGQPLPPPQPDTLPPPQGLYQAPYPRPPHAEGGAAPPPPPPLIPPLAQDPRHSSGRRGSGSGYDYPDPTNLAPVTPGGSTSAYPAHPGASQYYPPPPPHDRRTSPHPAYSYDGRQSTSPNSSSYSAVPPGQPGITPPPTSAPTSTGRAGGLGVRDMLNPGEGHPESSHGRSSTDSDMLNQLNRRGLAK